MLGGQPPLKAPGAPAKGQRCPRAPWAATRWRSPTGSIPRAQDDQFWEHKYRVSAAMVPTFVPRELADQIALIGKSINFIRVQCGDHQWAMDPEVRRARGAAAEAPAPPLATPVWFGLVWHLSGSRSAPPSMTVGHTPDRAKI